MATYDLGFIEAPENDFRHISRDIREIAEGIDIMDSAAVMAYGVGPQKMIAEISEKSLSTVRTKDTGNVGKLLSSLIGELKDFDVKESKGIKSLFNKGMGKAESLRARYDSVEGNINKVIAELVRQRQTLEADVLMLDEMYSHNLEYYKELTQYIEAGKMRLEVERSTTLSSLQEKARASNLPEDIAKEKEFSDMCDRFEKRLYDLELTRTISLQAGPQIRMVQESDTILAEKIQSAILNTIPLWKSQMVIALSANHSQKAAKTERAVNELTNSLLRKNADNLKSAAIKTAKEAERGIVDIDTLKHTNIMLIETIDELSEIRQSGTAKREEAEKELASIENELKEHLLSVASNEKLSA